ncbi:MULTISPECIES: transporter substrate-binding domain-containing protein [unclassified Beijerinckia]|uniref:substrate-binding periplasmic protein n=1 Tax=unclassified Beijerinckia TaxID=2638183 RepID=UPI00089D7BED|nr:MULTISPECIES: transporter substrate-binding domain-containing protein [unclassified Beijerinckia]SEB80376.1 amino acid ABC transporter substrate-binding protein, PAAT family [Beijerinckia sp. 28-YEA-48]
MRLLMVVLAFLGLAGVVSPSLISPSAAQAPATDLAGIISRGELRVALPAFDSVPFFYVREGALEGSDIDMARDIASKIGVKAVFTRAGGSFDDVVDRIATGGADVAICKLSRTLARARVVIFTRPYMALKHGLALNRVKFAQLARGEDPAAILRKYTGSLGVIQGSSFAQFARTNFPTADTREFDSWENVLASLRAGKLIAAYRDEFEIKKILIDDAAASLTLRTVTLLDLEDTLGMAVPAGSIQLAAFLDMYIANEVKSTSADAVIARYDQLVKQSPAMKQATTQTMAP